ncbi:MAG: trypsin-like peptidase domain-containing protein [Planctomycetes bacterium]|nr:trypsin-like peptidase domain-containing protein [Planctomycetota bacterium]
MVRFAATALALAATLHGISACGSELVLLDFWSPTCGPCMQMKPTVEAFINARYPIRQVDVSRESELAQQYRVTGVPCFVMLVDGQEVDRVVGATSSERLQQMFARAKEIVAAQRPKVVTQSPDNQPAPRATQEQGSWGGVGAFDKLSRADDPARPAAEPVSAQGPQVDTTEQDAAWTHQFDSKLLTSSVRLRVEDEKGLSHGTGTIIDAREGEALVITCGHLFRESKGKGPVGVELFEAGPQGVQVVESVSGQVISYDLERDVALVSIRPSHPVCVAPVAPPRTQITRGDRAASVGCSNGQDPTILATRVTWLDRYQGPPNVETSGAPVVGRSGGGLFNEEGQLMGICFAADYEGNKGLYAGLESIHDELKRLGLHEIYAKPDAGTVADGVADDFGPVADPIVRGQVAEDVTPAPPAAAIAIAPQGNNAAAPENLSATEQAALEEIVSRAATHEVVCIIRPKEPGGQSEVITLDKVSAEFVQALAARKREVQTPAIR